MTGICYHPSIGVCPGIFSMGGGTKLFRAQFTGFFAIANTCHAGKDAVAAGPGQERGADMHGFKRAH
jgi:hypothetical protein